jgi:hypothetical protein
VSVFLVHTGTDKAGGWGTAVKSYLYALQGKAKLAGVAGSTKTAKGTVNSPGGYSVACSGGKFEIGVGLSTSAASLKAPGEAYADFLLRLATKPCGKIDWVRLELVELGGAAKGHKVEFTGWSAK